MNDSSEQAIDSRRQRVRLWLIVAGLSLLTFATLSPFFWRADITHALGMAFFLGHLMWFAMIYWATRERRENVHRRILAIIAGSFALNLVLGIVRIVVVR
ncbi:MAG: hypothetical protein JST35_08305 [Armatimonadetes bacterium]|nr:hypothetical protein [Armatimonadota bacterium]